MYKNIMIRFCAAVSAVMLIVGQCATVYGASDEGAETQKKYIKWVDFGVTCDALCDTSKLDIETHGTDAHLGWIDALACLAVRYGGNFSGYRHTHLTEIAEAIKGGKTAREIAANDKLFDYYTEAYGAALSGMIGEHTVFEYGEDGSVTSHDEYGLMAFSPIASGYYYAHSDDFGVSRSYGYRRRHLGHDLMGSVGTPVIAVEGGWVEACGWNQYGGWRIGIRSFDNKRYYYYAHLRRGHPFCDMYEGKVVNAGEVIGYLGMTGYSSRENINNIQTPHLHYGLQVIFDPVQKDGTNQIWLDMFALTNFLYKNRAPVAKTDDGEFFSRRVCVSRETRD